MPNPSVQQLIDAYISMINERIMRGWEPTLLTFMFNELDATQIPAAMRDGVEECYATLVKRAFRRPRSIPLLDYPFWIVCTDFPIFKYDRDHLADITINGGRHMHGIALTPPDSRLGRILREHIESLQHLYAGRERTLNRLHAKTITDRPGYVADYALKALKSSRANLDDVIILPRTRSEL